MKPRSTLLGAAVLAVASAIGAAQIERLTLDEMVARIDNVVYGEIVAKKAFRVDHPVDGPELYFTTVTIEGRSLVDGKKITVDVTYHGGWVSEQEGVWNSEAPTEEETRVGKRVVAFYKWTNNMGGDVAANVLMTGHGGLYRTQDGPKGSVVLGRGEGYAVRKNVSVDSLDTAVTTIRASQRQK
jgi:hypothetical protein